MFYFKLYNEYCICGINTIAFVHYIALVLKIVRPNGPGVQILVLFIEINLTLKYLYQNENLKHKPVKCTKKITQLS